MIDTERERQGRDQILARVTADPALAAELYRRMDDIPVLAEHTGMSTTGALILYVRWLRRIVGPRPRMAAEVLAGVLDAEPVAEQDRLAEAVRREMKEYRKAFDTWQKVITQRAGRPMPPWLTQIAQEIEAGTLKRPKPSRGRAPGAGSVQHEAARRNIAELVYVLTGRIQAQGDHLATYSDTNPEAVTVCSITAQALTEEGIHRTATQVRDDWRAYKREFPDAKSLF